MSSLRSILAIVRSTGVSTVDLLEGSEDAEVFEVRIVESLSQLEKAGAGSLVVLDRRLSHIATTYQLDIAVRRIVSQEALGIAIFLSADSPISSTARAMARRSGIAMIRFDPTADITLVLRTMAQQVADELHLTIDRVRRASEAIGDVNNKYSSIEELVAVSSVILGREIGLSLKDDPDPIEFISVPAGTVFAAGPWLVTKRTNDKDTDALLEMFLWRLTIEASQCIIVEERKAESKQRITSEALLQLIQFDPNRHNNSEAIARELDLPVDGSHMIIRIEFDRLFVDDPGSSFQQREQLAQITRQAITDESGIWHVAHCPSMLVLLWTTESEIKIDSGRQAMRTIGDIVDALVHSTPGLQVFCGVGSARASIAGIVTSATEARFAASSARTRRRFNQVVSFDATGLQKSLAEWYSFESVHQSIDVLFAPLRKLSKSKRESLFETISTYLDLQGSINKTAEVMHLHRNAVSYRIRRAFEVLDIDESDPDQRLFLHLACRATNSWARLSTEILE